MVEKNYYGQKREKKQREEEGLKFPQNDNQVKKQQQCEPKGKCNKWMTYITMTEMTITITITEQYEDSFCDVYHLGKSVSRFLYSSICWLQSY